MTLIVENGTGVLKANSYVGLAYAQNYLTERSRVISSLWATATKADKEAALIKSTDYIDKRFGQKFLGSLLFSNLSVPASNMLIVTGLPSEDETITFNTTTYTFKVTPSDPILHIQIGGSVELTAANIASKANAQTDMEFYSTGAIVGMEAVDPGENSFPTSTTSDEISFEYDTLIGGSLEGQQPLCFPRDAFIGIPETLKMATVEYALRSLSEDLMPDPIVDESGQAVRRRSEKVGPVEEEVVFQTSPGAIFKIYPEADYLIKPLISDVGGVYR